MNEEKRMLIDYRLKRADEAIEESRLLCREAHYSSSVNRIYYALFYAVTALLIIENLSSSKHTGVKSIFDREFIKTGLIEKEKGAFYRDMFERRQKGDYLDYTFFEKKDVEKWIVDAHAFVSFIKGFLADKKGLGPH